MSVVKLSVVFIFLLSAFEIQAQTNFKSGYYISNEGDTVRGYIEYRFSRFNNKFCGFKATPDGEAKRFSPGEIKAFVVDDQDFYQSEWFTNKKGQQTGGFFRVLVKGNLSLYRYESRYFAKTSEGKLYEISKRTRTQGSQVGDDFYGVGILKVVMKDCGAISENRIKEAFSKSGFTDLFVEYNRCVGSNFVLSKKLTTGYHFDFGVTAGATYTMFAATTVNGVGISDENISYSAGGYASIFLPKVDERLRILLEATYTGNDFYNYYTHGFTNNDLFISYSAVKLPLFARYSLKKMFFDLGLQNQFIINEDQRWRVESVEQNTIYTIEGTVMPFETYSYGWLAGVGINLKVAGLTLKPSLRYSSISMPKHAYEPKFQTAELSVALEF